MKWKPRSIPKDFMFELTGEEAECLRSQIATSNGTVLALTHPDRPSIWADANGKEFENLKSHFATSSSTWGGRRKLPFCIHRTWGVEGKGGLNRRISNREQQNVEGQ